jgi:hypothetical protein
MAQARMCSMKRRPERSVNSTGGDARHPTDEYTANRINKPIYTITRRGIWKIDPQGNITKEEGPHWNKGIDGKNCQCN